MHGAELIVKVGDTATHRDGEILHVANRRRIMQVHAEHICHVKRAGTWTPWGHRPIALAYHYQDAVYRYCFSRVSKWEVVRHDRGTGAIKTVSNQPTEVRRGKWEAINVPMFVAHRLAHHRHRIFGEPGRELWFGGRQDFSMDVMQHIWNRITIETGIVPDTLRWPAGRKEIMNMLVLPLAHDLSDSERNDFVGERIAWREMVPLNVIPLIEQRGRPVDLRRRGVSAWLRDPVLEAA